MDINALPAQRERVGDHSNLVIFANRLLARLDMIDMTGNMHENTATFAHVLMPHEPGEDQQEATDVADQRPDDDLTDRHNTLHIASLALRSDLCLNPVRAWNEPDHGASCAGHVPRTQVEIASPMG